MQLASLLTLLSQGIAGTLLQAAPYDPMHDVSFSWWDELKYLWYYSMDVVTDYAWVVRVSYAVTLLSCLSILVIFVLIVRLFYLRRRERRYLRKLRRRYHEPLLEALSSPEVLTTGQVSEMMRLKGRQRYKRWQYRVWANLFTDLHDEVRRSLNGQNERITLTFYQNLRSALRAVNLEAFMEDTLRESIHADRLLIMQLVQQFHLDVAESTMVRLYNSKNQALRKSVRTFYMWQSQEDPFRFVEENGDFGYRPMDTLMMHRIFGMRRQAGKPIPSIVPFILRTDDEKLRAFLIREVGWWGEPKDVRFLERYFQDKVDDCRAAAFESVGRARLTELEPQLMQCYSLQPEELKRVVLFSVQAMASGRAVPFYEQAAHTSASRTTKRLALQCLWNYGEAGRAAFHAMQQRDTQEEQLLYQHIECDFTPPYETYLSKHKSTKQD